MSWINRSLLLGLALVLVPVVLHLLMRSPPKRIVFPALRLIQQRQQRNRTRMRVRHLWLLLLRMLVIAVLVLAVARPSLPPANYTFTTLEWAGLLGVLVAAGAAYFFGAQRSRVQGGSQSAQAYRRLWLRLGVGAGTLLLLSLLVVWPYARRVRGEITAPMPSLAEHLPVIAVMLIDTSPSMEYRQQNQSRLQVARKFAAGQLGRLPTGSRVAIADTRGQTPFVFSGDLAAAQNRLEALEVQPLAQSLTDRLRTVIAFQEDDRRRTLQDQSAVPEAAREDRYLREVYIFSDLQQSAFRREDSGLRELLANHPWLGLYLIDVSAEQPVNVGLSGMRLSRQSVSAGSSVNAEAVVRSVGTQKPDQAVELYLRGDDGQLIKAGQQQITLTPGAETRVQFQVDVERGNYRQGELRLTAADPLSIDDSVAFTIRVMAPEEVLVVSDQREAAVLWLEALNGLTQGKVGSFRPRFVRTSELKTGDLKGVESVILINASALTDEVWQGLKSFVNDGGGLAVCLGEYAASTLSRQRPGGIQTTSYNSRSAQELLPARLRAQLRFTPAVTIDWRSGQHPLLNRIDAIGAIPELSLAEVRRYWSVEPGPDANLIARYADEPGSPALLERRLGGGKVVLMTTAVDNKVWNDLPANGWTYLALVDQLQQWLSRQAAAECNFIAGDEITVPLPAKQRPNQCLLRTPDLKQRLVDLPAEERLTLKDVVARGNYELLPREPVKDFAAGFSVNLPAAESDLTPITTADLDQLFGERRYSVDRDPQSLVRNVNAGRLGQEVYGILLALLIAFFALEQITAGWFYPPESSNAPEPARQLPAAV